MAVEEQLSTSRCLCCLQPNQRNIATPPSRLLSASGHKQQQHTVQLLQQPNNRNVAPRYGRTSETAAAAYPAVQGASALAHAADAAGSSNLYLGIADTLEQELSRGGNLAAGGAAANAQQRLLAAGAVDSSDASILGSSHWLPSAVHTEF